MIEKQEYMMNIFCDLDGVMADFDRGFENKFGSHPRHLKNHILWSHINSDPTFWIDLPPTHDYMVLWENIRTFNPIILTGCPSTNFKWASTEKRKWVRKYLGDVKVITCLSKDKQLHMINPSGDILIDDFKSNCKRWESSGGTSILHTSALNTTKALDSITLDCFKNLKKVMV